MKKLSFVNKDGFPSAYGFSCGNALETEQGVKMVSLYKEHNSFHVKAIDYSIGSRGHWNGSNGRYVWLSYDNAEIAKRAYKQQCKRLGLPYNLLKA